MAYRKIIVIMSGSGNTGIVKLAGSFDGLNKIKGECKCELSGTESKLYVLADEVTEITLHGDKKTFEVPISAKNDVCCLLSTGGKTLTGSSGGRVDRRQLEGRIDMFRREKAKRAREQRESGAREREAERKRIAQAEAANDADGADAAEAQDKSARNTEHDDNAERGFGTVAGEELPCADVGKSECPPCGYFAGGRTQSAEDSYVNSVLRGGVAYDGTNFYQAVKPQLDEMFVRYPAEERLNAVVPNSKWVRIDVDDDDFYVLGVLFDLSEPTFICYGIPGMRNVPPPAEIADVSVWLPLNGSQNDTAGFWVIYQSAHNGKCIK